MKTAKRKEMESRNGKKKRGEGIQRNRKSKKVDEG